MARTPDRIAPLYLTILDLETGTARELAEPVQGRMPFHSPIPLRHQWLEDGSLLVLDMLNATTEAAVRIDPATGEAFKSDMLVEPMVWETQIKGPLGWAYERDTWWAPLKLISPTGDEKVLDRLAIGWDSDGRLIAVRWELADQGRSPSYYP